MLKKLLLGLLLLCWQFLQAQEKNLSGVVKDDDGFALPGVSVKVQGKKAGTTTNIEGKFTLQASPGDVLLLTYVGMFDETVKVGSANTINVKMRTNAAVLDDVVITAYGMGKSSRTLGYATQTLNGDDLAETQRENVLNALTSRVAGATVNSTSGAPGASSSVVLRGFNSLSGNNSPIIVVDGLPINNSTLSTGVLTNDNSNRSNDYTNRAADINPNDIASITVLKGPEATALYGIDAGSGAIIITTKKGQAGKGRFTYDNSFRVDQTYLFPELQYRYGTGLLGTFNPTTRQGLGQIIPFDTRTYNNIETFFQDAFTQKHNVTFDGGKKNITYRVSGSTSNQGGTVPNTGYDRYNARGTVAYKSKDKRLDVSSTLAYTYSYNQKALRGAGGFLQGLISWPSTDDASNYLKEDGTRRKFLENFGNSSIAEIDNPYWSVNKNQSSDKTDRYNYNLSASYKALPWLNLIAKGSYDGYKQTGNTFYHPLSNDFANVGGQLEEYTANYKGFSGVFIAAAEKQFKKIEMGFKLGFSNDDFRTETFSKRGQRLVAQVVGDQPYINNFRTIDPATYLDSRSLGRDTLTLRRLQGIFGEYTFNYNRWFNLSITGRNDWTSTLPSQSRSFFYPSISTAIIFTDLLPKSRVLTFGKLRASAAQTAKDISPYGSQSVYAKQLTSGLGLGYGFVNNNPFIVPERQKTYELGTELQFFNKRISFDAAYYNTKNIGQIVRLVRLSYGTGFVLSTLNVADTRNEGVEFMLNGQPIKRKDFVWNVNVNFSKTGNEVLNLPANIPEYYNSDTFVSAFRNGLIPGGTTTSITGQDYLRNSKGQILVDPGTGYGIVNPNYVKIGDRNPDFNIGLGNSVSYKNLNFSFQLDIRKGGDIMNGTAYSMATLGLHPVTLDRETPIIVPGVLNDGLQETANPTANTIQILPQYQTYLQDGRIYPSAFMEKNINWLRLRDVTVRYKIPANYTSRMKGIENVSVFFTGTDLFTLSNYSGADPSANSNTASTQGIGGFGIDWFSPSTPRGFNAGLRFELKAR
jgi:TonB-linked SusC/RagA family outer membrane protein